MKHSSHILASQNTMKPSPGLVVRFMLITALVLLPFSHLRWLPNLGTTRPASSVIFVFALGLILLPGIFQSIRRDGFSSRNLFGLDFLRSHLLLLSGWQILLPWIMLIGLGIVSAAFTPWYGNFFQALNRLLGYGIIFVTLYCGLYATKIFSIEKVATWISLGYLPVLAYGIIEAAATQQSAWALQVVKFVREWVVVGFAWAARTSYFATEPSFVGFQLLLLIALMPYLPSRLLRLTNFLIILIALIFSKSGNIVIQVAAYFVFLAFLRFRKPIQVWLLGISAAVVSTAGIWYSLFSPFQLNPSLFRNLSIMLDMPRLYFIAISSMIRGNHILNLVYAIIDTRGLGLGIGQYGHFWKDIFLRHFDLQLSDPSGEIALSLASPEYGRPWSVIFGIGVDLGVVGFLILLGFFYLIWRAVATPHGQAILLASVIALIGAYPIVTPHVWLALALLAALPAPAEIAQPAQGVAVEGTAKA